MNWNLDTVGQGRESRVCSGSMVMPLREAGKSKSGKSVFEFMCLVFGGGETFPRFTMVIWFQNSVPGMLVYKTHASELLGCL